MLPEDFYKTVEEPGFLKRVLYSDTDSIYIVIPKKNVQDMPVEKKWEIAGQAADDINNMIIKYLTEWLLPRSNVSPEFNKTDFKKELLMDSIMFLDVKKNYAYRVLCKEGNFFDKPKVKYTGIQVVKSDAAKMTQNLLKDMIENVLLNIKVEPNKRSALIVNLVNDYYNQFQTLCNNFDLLDVSHPGKWGKKDHIINGMKLYNYIVEEEIFSTASAGKFMYCRFQNFQLFPNLDTSKTNGICFPYNYDKEFLREKMNQFGISIDKQTQWSKIFTTTCQRVVDLSKVARE